MKALIISLLLFGILSRFPSSIQAKIELTIVDTPEYITAEEQVVTTVQLSGSNPETKYFIRGAFFEKDTTRYFGLTQNNNDHWKSYDAASDEFYEIQGDGTYSIAFQLDKTSPYFSDIAASYQFRVGRFTQGGSHTWADSEPLTITIHSQKITPTPTVPIATPSPLPNPTPTATSTVIIDSQLVLSEVFPCQTESQAEWVELYNPSNVDVPLTNWVLRDSTTTQKIQLSGNIPAKKFLVVHLPSAILNNSGDAVRLLSPSDQIVDQMSYSSCTEKSSWIHIDSTWKHTTHITQGSANIYEQILSETPSTVEMENSVIKADEQQTVEHTVLKKQTAVLGNQHLQYSLPNRESVPKSIDSNKSNVDEDLIILEENSATNRQEQAKPLVYLTAVTGASHILAAVLLYQKTVGFTLL